MRDNLGIAVVCMVNSTAYVTNDEFNLEKIKNSSMIFESNGCKRQMENIEENSTTIKAISYGVGRINNFCLFI